VDDSIREILAAAAEAILREPEATPVPPLSLAARPTLGSTGPYHLVGPDAPPAAFGHRGVLSACGEELLDFHWPEHMPVKAVTVSPDARCARCEGWPPDS
jgi:hypothetical protein